MNGGARTTAVSLLFAEGQRPVLSSVARLADAGAGFSISHDPGDNGAIATGGTQWVELIANGLTFDMEGLAGGPPADLPASGHIFGISSDLDGARLRAVTMKPGKHLAAGATMLPVLRTLAHLAAQMTALEGLRAVAWHPARCWSEPEKFRTGITSWVEGGVFPAFSLVALAPVLDGGMQSEGLALFTGQELRLEPEVAGDAAEAGKLAVRLLHWLYERGRLTATEHLALPGRVRLRLEPSANGRFVRVWKV
ncbi:MAG TPA: hypothetical protein VNR60_12245 [Croceibacterium sp.]|nr:hypothetical protein [Croceibacterium sp.]